MQVIIKKIFFSLFSIAMLILFLLQAKQCLIKVLHPSILKVNTAYEATELELPGITLCRKGFKVSLVSVTILVTVTISNFFRPCLTARDGPILSATCQT